MIATQTEATGVPGNTFDVLEDANPKADLQKVDELDEESKETPDLSNQKASEEQVELQIQEKNVELTEFKEDINNQWVGQTDEALRVRDDFIDSINNSALMEAEKIQKNNILSYQDSPMKSGQAGEEVLSEEEDIKETK